MTARPARPRARDLPRQRPHRRQGDVHVPDRRPRRARPRPPTASLEPPDAAGGRTLWRTRCASRWPPRSCRSPSAQLDVIDQRHVPQASSCATSPRARSPTTPASSRPVAHAASTWSCMTSLVGKYPFDVYGVLAADELFGYALETQTLSLHPAFIVDETRRGRRADVSSRSSCTSSRTSGSATTSRRPCGATSGSPRATPRGTRRCYAGPRQFGVSMRRPPARRVRAGQPVPRGLRAGRAAGAAATSSTCSPTTSTTAACSSSTRSTSGSARRRSTRSSTSGPSAPRRVRHARRSSSRTRPRWPMTRSLVPFLRDWLYGTTIPPMPGPPGLDRGARHGGRGPRLLGPASARSGSRTPGWPSADRDRLRTSRPPGGAQPGGRVPCGHGPLPRDLVACSSRWPRSSGRRSRSRSR